MLSFDTLTVALRARLPHCASLHHHYHYKKKSKKKKLPVPGIEPARIALLRSEVQCLNHSATEAALHIV